MISIKEINEYTNMLGDNYITVGECIRDKNKSYEDGEFLSMIPINKVKRDIKQKFKGYKIRQIKSDNKHYFFEIRKKRARKYKRFNIWYVKKHELPSSFFWLSYPQNFVMRAHEDFKNKGYYFDQWGLSKGIDAKNRKRIKMKNHKDIFKRLNKLGFNYPYKSPCEQEEIEISGGNIFTSVGNFFKSGVKIVGNVLKTGFNIIKNIPEALKGPRKDYPPFFREFKKKYGDIRIRNITVCKNPIQKTFDTIINVISFGNFGKMKDKLNYDDMFHLFLMIELDTGQLVRLEKNQVLNIGFMKPLVPKAQLKVPMDPSKHYSINSLLDPLAKKLGVSMYLYNGINNNCQFFVRNVLAEAGLLDKVLNDFIMQDTQKIIGELPGLSKLIIQGATDAGAVFDVLLYGRGILKMMKNKAFRAKYMNFGGCNECSGDGDKKITLEDAKKYGKKLKINFKKIDIKQFMKGLKEEQEHKNAVDNNMMTVAKITLDHLKEYPDYYDKLEQMKKDDKKDVILKKSTRKDKKFVVIVDGKKIHFGAKGMSDFTKHKDDKRKINYIIRHQKKENWNKSGIHTAGFWAKHILWSKPSLKKAINYTNKRFNLNIKYKSFS
jgi:hypothetical protein